MLVEYFLVHNYPWICYQYDKHAVPTSHDGVYMGMVQV